MNQVGTEAALQVGCIGRILVHRFADLTRHHRMRTRPIARKAHSESRDASYLGHPPRDYFRTRGRDFCSAQARGWRSEAGEFDEEAETVDVLLQYEAKIVALERLVGRQPLEIENLPSVPLFSTSQRVRRSGRRRGHVHVLCVGWGRSREVGIRWVCSGATACRPRMRPVVAGDLPPSVVG